MSLEIFDHLETSESNEGYFTSLLVEKINKSKADLEENHNFDNKLIEKVKQAITRKNIIYYGLIQGEFPVKIQDTKGNVTVPIIQKDQILKKISSIKNKEAQKKIGWIHISTLQILLKSTMKIGINAPMKLSLRDNRLINESEALLAQGNGNLGAGKIKFNINIFGSFSLLDTDLSRSIILDYELLRKDLMKEGNSPFSITFRVNYALTNSHHSINFKNKETIEIDDLFENVLSLSKQPVEIPFQPERKFLENKETQKEEKKPLIGTSNKELWEGRNFDNRIEQINNEIQKIIKQKK